MTKSPTVLPAENFDPEADADVLRAACKGFGTDEDAIIDILTKRTNEQRQQIALQFKTMFGKDLISELKSELNGNFEDLILALMTEPIQYQAKELHNAIDGMGTEESTLIEILTIHDNEEIHQIASEYESLYETSLEDDLKGDSSGTLKRLLVSLSTGHRDETNTVDQEEAFKDARDLLNAGELMVGTDESTFNAVLCQRNRRHLTATFNEYERIVGHTIEDAIEKEFSGTEKDSLLQLVQCMRNRTDYLATRLHDSMSGMGTDDRTLIRLVVGRSEKDLGEIKEAYEAKYGKSLAERISDDVSGDSKKALLSLLG